MSQDRTFIDIVLDNWLARAAVVEVTKEEKIPAKFSDLLLWLYKKKSIIQIFIHGVRFDRTSLNFSCYFGHEDEEEGLCFSLL